MRMIQLGESLKTHVVLSQVFADVTRPKTCVLGRPAFKDKQTS